MKNKLLLISLLALNTYAHEHTPVKGFFIGIEGAKVQPGITYKTVGAPTTDHEIDDSTNEMFLKLGYQYYNTKIYLMANEYKYTESNDRYKIKGTHYEVDIDYIPTFYTAKEFPLKVKGVFGFAFGYSFSKLYDVKNTEYILPVDHISSYSQKNYKYGIQIGVETVIDDHWGIEMGYKYRKGTLLDFKDDEKGTNRVSYVEGSTRYYFGVNYVF